MMTPAPVLYAALIAAVGANAGQCRCNGQSGAGDDQNRVDYGSRCARWDAPDEKPWCSVDAGACGDETYKSEAGHFWSHAPCGLRTTDDKVPLSSPSSSSLSPSVPSWTPSKWLSYAKGDSCLMEIPPDNQDCTVAFRPPVSVWRHSFVQGKTQPWWPDFIKFQRQLRRVVTPDDCKNVVWADLHVPSTYGITANLLEHTFLDLLPLLLNGTTPVITGGDDQWAEQDAGMQNCRTMFGCYMRRISKCTQMQVSAANRAEFYPRAPFEHLYGRGLPKDETAWRTAQEPRYWFEHKWGGLLFEAALIGLNVVWEPKYEALMQARLQKIGLLEGGKCIALHVRRGDMHGAGSFRLESYAKSTLALAQNYGIKSVFVMSDSAEVIAQVRKMTSGQLRIFYSNSDRSMYTGKRVEDVVGQLRKSGQASTMLHDLYTDVYAASHCDAFVGHFGLTHVARLALDMMILRKRAVPPFVSLGPFSRMHACRGCWRDSLPCYKQQHCETKGFWSLLKDGNMAK